MNIGTFVVLYHFLSAWYIAASVCAFLLSFVVSFTLQRFWTFDHRTREGLGRHAMLYFCTALGNLAFNTAIVYVLVSELFIWPVIAQIVGGIAVAATSYVIYSRYIFKHPT